jgi:heterodisulfide reductase subunit B
MNRFLYFPGCAMEASAKAYHVSLMAITEMLGLDLDEINDWNCCGATEYLGLRLTPAYSLIGRNLALAALQSNGSHTVVSPCSACYLNLSKADYYMRERPLLGERVNEALAAGGLRYDPGTLEIRHLLDVVLNEVGVEKIRELVVRPLHGLRVAPYMGCMLPRPDYAKRWSDHEQPNELDRLLKALGADVIDFHLRTECCGGHMTQIGPDTAYELIRRILDAADRAEADLLATVCPMCQLNLDAYQKETNKHFGTRFQMPILFFTQLMGLAFGFGQKEMGIGMEIVSAESALSKISAEPPPEPEKRKAPARRNRDDKSLPMPRVNGQGG